MPLLMQTMQQQMGGGKRDIREVNGRLVDVTGGTPQEIYTTPKEPEKPTPRKYDVVNGVPGWIDEGGFTPDPNAPKKADDKPSKTISQQNAEALGLKPGTKEYNDYIRADTLPQAATGGEGDKPPSGYRRTKDGNLEFIPGGPADPAKNGGGSSPPTVDQAKANQLYTRSSAQLPIVIDNFDALASTVDQGKAAISLSLASGAYQRAHTALEDIAASYIYSVSGQAAPPSEVAALARSMMPRFGEAKGSLDDKKQRIQDMVESIKLRSSNPGQQAPASAAKSDGGGWTTLPNGIRIREKK